MGNYIIPNRFSQALPLQQACKTIAGKSGEIETQVDFFAAGNPAGSVKDLFRGAVN
ncbi:MAG: hypothetical protein IPP73_12795 [Chitinophagaceae bacterium]|nr:hypothetical protein [Chitinophagaceae bacterium]